MDKYGGRMLKINNSNGEVSMRMKTDKTPNSSGWLAKVSRLLIFTMLFSTFMPYGLYTPQRSVANVSKPGAWANYSNTAPAVISGNVTSTAFTPAAGANRLLVAGVCMEVGTGTVTVTTMDVRLDNAAGTVFTQINTTGATAQREHCYMGYLKESQIPAGAHSIYVNYAISANTVTGLHVNAATFADIDQTTPINSSGQNNSAAVTVTFGAAAIAYLQNGMTTYIASNGGTPVTESTPATPAFTEDSLTAGTAACTTATAVTAAHAAAGSYASPTTITFAGTTSARSALVVASFRPATTTVGDGTTPANKTVYANDTNKAVSTFTLQAGSAGTTDTVTGLVITGSGTGLANVAASGVKIWRDNGTTPNEWDASDTLVGAGVSFSGTTATFTGLNIAVTNTATQYLITCDIIASPTASQTILAAVTGLTSPNVLTNNDNTDATLTTALPADVTPPTPGTVTVSPDTGVYVNANPTITTTFTDNESAVTNCWYTTNGSWPGTAGALSGSSPTWTCTANPAGLSGAVTLNMRALSTGGTGTATALSRTVDSTNPTDGTLTVTPGDTQNALSWSGFGDAASGLRSSNTYTIRFAQSVTAPANCTTGSLVPGYAAGTSATHTGLTNGLPYSYRVCAFDNVNNGPSTGATGSGTPASTPPDQLTVSGNTPIATSTKADTAAYVVMQRFQMDSNAAGNSNVLLTGIGIDDVGTVTTVAAVRIYTSTTASTALPSNAVLVGKISSWNGQPQVISLNLGTAADRTVTNPTSKYAYVLYDMFDGMSGLTTRSSITAVYVASPDTIIASPVFPYQSNLITLTTGTNKATVTSCTDCHGNPPVDGTRSAVTGSFLGSHTKHANTQPANLGLTCTICHQDNGVAGDPYPKGTGHRDGNIDMLTFFMTYTGSYSKGTVSGTVKSFPQSDAPTFGTCNNVYCHSTVQGASGVGAGADKPKTWGAAGPIGCGACHVDMSGASATGSHVQHTNTTAGTYNMACNTCHTGYTKTTADATRHLNMTIDVTPVTGFYTGGTTSGDHTPGGGYGACKNVYCHSQGTVGTAPYSAPNFTPTWGTPLNCDGCHTGGTVSGPTYATGSPKANSHPKHVTTNTGICYKCHYSTTTIGTAITNTANHNDGNYDLMGSGPTATFAVTVNGTFTVPTQCSNISCHFNGSATWGTTLTCASCHNSLSGAHAKHIYTITGAVYGSLATNVSSTEYWFGCGNCHPTDAATYHANGTINLDVARGVSGLKLLNGLTTTVTGTGNNTRCGSVYCHSDGKGTFTMSPTWGSTYASAFNTCGQCHGNAPTSDAHAAHSVGIHYDDVFNGTSGLTPSTGNVGVSAGHGDPAQSTTINCNICHSNTVTKSRNKYGTACTGCHGGNADNPNAVVTADMNKVSHIDGLKTVVFAATTITSKAQIRDPGLGMWTRATGTYKKGTAASRDTSVSMLNTAPGYTAAKNCTVVCHNDTTINWTSTPITCDKCHTTLP